MHWFHILPTTFHEVVGIGTNTARLRYKGAVHVKPRMQMTGWAMGGAVIVLPQCIAHCVQQYKPLIGLCPTSLLFLAPPHQKPSTPPVIRAAPEQPHPTSGPTLATPATQCLNHSHGHAPITIHCSSHLDSPQYPALMTS